MSLKQKLNSLYCQQHKLTAAGYGTDDPGLKRTLELKQQMLGRKIGRAQAQEKVEREK
ncbi:hypothetical protein KJ707_00790 [Patescibacteria group bacterium]|nr:hypothetical protein [Patescibacteria group bacterium]MBU2543090.1 hypothetical protein [Patescibacteria group bacterium]